jgi:hypothetical protein
MIESLLLKFCHIRYEIKRDFRTAVQDNYCSAFLILHKSIQLKIKIFRSAGQRCNIFNAHSSAVPDDIGRALVLFCRP